MSKKLISIKRQEQLSSCRVYHGLYSCTGNYIGESKRNVAIGWGEHNNPTHNSHPAKHLTNTSNIVTDRKSWQMLLNTQKQERAYRR